MEEHFQHGGQHHHHHKHVEKECQGHSHGDGQSHHDRKDKKELDRERKDRARARQKEAKSQAAAAQAGHASHAAPAKAPVDDLAKKLAHELRIKGDEKPKHDAKFVGTYTFKYTTEEHPATAELRLNADGTFDLEVVVEHACEISDEIKDIQDYTGSWGSDATSFVIAVSELGEFFKM